MWTSQDCTTFLFFLFVPLVLQYASTFTIIVEDPDAVQQEESQSGPFPYQPGSEEFRRWLVEEEEKTVQKILAKIASPNDTLPQLEAKIAVARYLVNVTFTTMTRRLNLGRKVVVVPDSPGIPSSPEAPSTTESVDEAEVVQVEQSDNSTEASSSISNSSSTTISSISTSTTEAPTTTPEIIVFGGGGNLTSPSESIPASAPATASTENGTDTATEASRPIWQEILNFNFSAALGGGSGGFNLSRLTGGGGGGPAALFNISRLTGGGGSGASLFNISRLTGGGGEGGASLFNISRLTGGGGEGGASLFNISRLTGGGGEGGASLFNISRLTGGGGEGGGSLFNISLLTGGGGGGNSLFNLTRLTGGSSGEGGGFFNLSRLTGSEGGGSVFNLSRFEQLRNASFFNISAGGQATSRIQALLNATSSLNFSLPMGGEGGGLLSNLNISEGLPLAIPTITYIPPEPMNNSVTMSQMYLSNQVDKLVEDVNKSNLTGVVDSTLSIATPSTVGVLVNALLNIVLCNPLDRWHGNCGV